MLPERLKSSARQTVFDFESLLGSYRTRALLRVPEIAKMLGRSRDFIIAEIEAGKLHGHGLPDRAREERSVPPRSVALWLAETAEYEGAEYEARLRDLFATWTPEQRRWAVQTLLEMGGSK